MLVGPYLIGKFMTAGGAYFLPRQLRGPTWNGCTALFLSFSNPFSPSSQRSGIYSSARLKCFGEWNVAHWVTLTILFSDISNQKSAVH